MKSPVKRPRFAGYCVIVALLAMGGVPPAVVAAQQAVQHATTPATSQSPDSIELFARTHLAVAALRDRYQAQFAEPQNKKREVQDALHEKLQTELQALLKEHGYSGTSYARMTRFVSVDSAARRAFEEALAREGKK